MSYEYRIIYSIQRHDEYDDDTDFEEIGFGSSCAWNNPTDCGEEVAAQIVNRSWETEAHHPDPEEVDES